MRERRSKNAFKPNDLLNHVRKRIVLQPSLLKVLFQNWCPVFFLYPRVNLYFSWKLDFFSECFFLRFPSACATFYVIVKIILPTKNARLVFPCSLPILLFFFLRHWDFVLYFSKTCSKFTFLQTHWPCMTPNRAKQTKKKPYVQNEWISQPQAICQVKK